MTRKHEGLCCRGAKTPPLINSLDSTFATHAKVAEATTTDSRGGGGGNKETLATAAMFMLMVSS